MVGGGNLGNRGGGDSGNRSQLRRWCKKTTPFGCLSKERQGEARGAPRQGYLCGNNRYGSTLPPSLPIIQAHVARSVGAGGTDPLVATMSTMRPGTGNVATASAPGQGERKGSIDDCSKDNNDKDELNSGGGNAAGGKEGTPLKRKGWRGKKQKKRDV